MINALYAGLYVFALLFFLWGTHAMIGISIERYTGKDVGRFDYVIATLIYLVGITLMIISAIQLFDWST